MRFPRIAMCRCRRWYRSSRISRSSTTTSRSSVRAKRGDICSSGGKRISTLPRVDGWRPVLRDVRPAYRRASLSPLRRTLLLWLAVGAAGFLVVPWYAVQDSLLGVGWIKDFADKDNAPALLQALTHGRMWLLPLGLLLVAFTPLLRPTVVRRSRANGLIA